MQRWHLPSARSTVLNKGVRTGPRSTARATGTGSLDTHCSLFIFGCGYTATRLVQHLRCSHSVGDVFATCTRPEGRQALQKLQTVPFLYSPSEGVGLSAAGCEALAAADLVLDSTPPLQCPAGESPSELLGSCRQGKQWVGYLSTTSVYGDHQGGMVSEGSPLRAADPKALARIAAEQAWIGVHKSRGLPVHVFRLAGIYGPSRSALDAARQLAEGGSSASQARRMLAPYTSRVHVDDICRALCASMAAPNPGAVYNVADDDPTGRREVMRHACQLLGIDTTLLPPQQAADLAPRPSSKRVSNAKLKKELCFELKYPTYREGLAAILEHELAQE